MATDSLPSNPFLADVGIRGLTNNLMNLPPEWALATFTGAFEPQRLAAIAQQAENINQQAMIGVQTVGTLLAHAANTGNLDPNETADAGWLVLFLGQLAALTDLLAANARHAQEYGPIIGRAPT